MATETRREWRVVIDDDTTTHPTHNPTSIPPDPISPTPLFHPHTTSTMKWSKLITNELARSILESKSPHHIPNPKNRYTTRQSTKPPYITSKPLDLGTNTHLAFRPHHNRIEEESGELFQSRIVVFTPNCLITTLSIATPSPNTSTLIESNPSTRSKWDESYQGGILPPDEGRIYRKEIGSEALNCHPRIWLHNTISASFPPLNTSTHAVSLC